MKHIGLPSRVKVLGTRYKVYQQGDLKVRAADAATSVYSHEDHDQHESFNVLGITDPDMGVILIETEQGADRFQITLLHELLHAICAEAALKDVLDGDKEERMVKRMAPILRQVLKDNPSVYTFITGRRLW